MENQLLFAVDSEFYVNSWVITKLTGYNFNYYINFYFLGASLIDIVYCPTHNARYTLGKALPRQFSSFNFYVLENAVAKDEISWNSAKATTDHVHGINSVISVWGQKCRSHNVVTSSQRSVKWYKLKGEASCRSISRYTRWNFPLNLKPEINMLLNCMVEIRDRKIVIYIFLTTINFFFANSTLVFTEHMMGSCKADKVLTVGEILWCDHSNKTFLALLSHGAI